MDIESYLQYPRGFKEELHVIDSHTPVQGTPCHSLLDESPIFTTPSYSKSGGFSPVCNGFSEIALRFPEILHDEHFNAFRTGFEERSNCVFLIGKEGVLQPILGPEGWARRNMTCNNGCICFSSRLHVDSHFLAINYQNECEFIDLRNCGIESAFIRAPLAGEIRLQGNELLDVEIECSNDCIVYVDPGNEPCIISNGITLWD